MRLNIRIWKVITLNPFKCNENLGSYTYSIAKILICVVIIIVVINSNRFIPIDLTKFFTELFIRIISVGFVISSIMCIYISASEMILIHENRTKNNILLRSGVPGSKEYSIDEIIYLVEKNDIIEIEIFVNSNLVEIGSCSNCEKYDSQFYDKFYYFDKCEFVDINNFKSSLSLCSVNGKIWVNAIDGIRTK